MRPALFDTSDTDAANSSERNNDSGRPLTPNTFSLSATP